jgi:EmrB/QacA subfamily drug resistance transporter
MDSPRVRSHPRSPPDRRWLVMAVVLFGTFVVSLDTTVNVALPAMTEALDAPIPRLQWVIIAYVLTNTSLVLGFGRLADMVGRRQVWCAGLVALAAALLGCGLAQSLGMLVAARGFQALGAAMTLASGAALVTAAFPTTQRGRALGLLAFGASAGQATGPLLGGALVSAFGWQAVFLGRAPLALAAALLSLALLPLDRRAARRERFDLLGTALLGAAVAGLLLALNRGPVWGWLDPRTGGLALAASALLAGFVARERSFTPPVIDLRLFRSLPFAAANVAGFLSSLAMFGVWLLVPYYLVDGRGHTAVQSGWFLACVPATTALTAPLSGWLSDRIGARLLSALGLLLEAAALLLIARLDQASPAPVVVGGLVALGVGLGIFMAPNQSVVMGSVPPAALGVAGGMLSMMRTLGVVSGVAVLGAVYTAGQPPPPDGGVPPFSIDAFRAAFLVAAGVALAAAVFLAARPNPPAPFPRREGGASSGRGCQ